MVTTAKPSRPPRSASASAFIRRTYAHVAAAVLAFVGIEAVLIGTGIAKDIVSSMFASNMAWIGLMVVFIGGTFAAQYMARSRSSVGMQYAGLTLYVLLYARPLPADPDHRVPAAVSAAECCRSRPES